MNTKNYIQQVHPQESFMELQSYINYLLTLINYLSNINTATYHLAEQLSKVLSPLRESEHNIKSTNDFIRQIKKEPIPTGYEMVSFDVKSLFTNVPLDRTIDIILRRIYDHKELEKSITKSEMKEMLTLCTKISILHTVERFLYKLMVLLWDHQLGLY